MFKRIFTVCLAVFLGAAAFGQSKAVWDDAKKQYAIEPGAKITVSVDSDKWGAAIVALWDKTHPDAKGAVTYVRSDITGSTDKITQLQEDFSDLVMAIDGEVARNAQSVLPLDSHLIFLGNKVTQPPFFKNANPTDVVKYIPISYDGMSFAYNLTMLKKLGLDTTLDKDGLPVSCNTWEKIFALAQQWKAKRPVYNGTPVTIVYPMCLTEVWSAYSSLTAGGWEIFKDADSSNPGFDKPEFVEGLRFIKAAADAGVSVEVNGKQTPGASMTTRWEDFLNNQTAPFGLVGTWMDIKGAMTKGKFEMHFAPMPTWKGKRLTPFVKTKGFVINGFTHFPSATHELYRLIYTKVGMEDMIENSSYIPAVRAGSPITPDISKDKSKEEMAKAFASNYAEPPYFLPKNKFKKSMDVYYNIPLSSLYIDVWDGKLTPEAAQKQAVSLAAKWFAENNK